MKDLQKRILLDAYRILQKMTFGKTMSQTVRRAVRVRLQAILEEEEKTFEHWGTNVKHKLNKTRQEQVAREFKKRIQAYKITIHSLTPFWERETDVPTFVVKKDKKE